MDIMAIFGLQFFLSFVAWGAGAKWLTAPWLEKKDSHEALSWLVLPHMFRHLGMVFLVPGVVARPLPPAFANPAAYGDLLAGVLALAAFAALRTGRAGALALVWLFNIVGTAESALRRDRGHPEQRLPRHGLGLVHPYLYRSAAPDHPRHYFCAAV